MEEGEYPRLKGTARHKLVSQTQPGVDYRHGISSPPHTIVNHTSYAAEARCETVRHSDDYCDEDGRVIRPVRKGRWQGTWGM